MWGWVVVPILLEDLAPQRLLAALPAFHRLTSLSEDSASSQALTWLLWYPCLEKSTSLQMGYVSDACDTPKLLTLWG